MISAACRAALAAGAGAPRPRAPGSRPRPRATASRAAPGRRRPGCPGTRLQPRQPAPAIPARRRLPGSGRGGTRCGFRPRRSTICSTSSARSCSTGPAGSLAGRPSRAVPQDVAEALGGGRPHARRPQGHRDRDADAAARGDHRARCRASVRDFAQARTRKSSSWSAGARHRARPGDPGEPVRPARAPAPQRGDPRDRIPGRARSARASPPAGGSSCAPRRAAASSRSSSPTTAEALSPEVIAASAAAKGRWRTFWPGRIFDGGGSDRSRRARCRPRCGPELRALTGRQPDVRSEPGQGMEVVLLLPLALALHGGAALRACRRRVRRPARRGGRRS